ncbi:MAG TPA: hypothetical protein VH062_00695, partial [Polyangiaceae bacterium]|nr:hypothetical protein [Polyangiaceae bacterium]
SSDDDVTRTAALLSLRAVTDAAAPKLSADVYQDLTDKADPELQLLFQCNAVEPLPQDVKEQVYDIATASETSGRVRDAAVRAFAHPEDSGTLDRLASQLIESTAEPSLATNTAMAFGLGRCGAACESTLERLAASSSAAERGVAYRAIAFVPDLSLQAKFRTQLVAGGNADELEKAVSNPFASIR